MRVVECAHTGGVMRTLDEYLALITPEHADKPKFVASLSVVLQTLIVAGDALALADASYDLDAATGAQLDVLGEWIGRSRQIPVLVQAPWFEFDRSGRGFDQAQWKDSDVLLNSIVTLDDETYRRLLRAKIVANEQPGTLAGIQAALDMFFSGSGGATAIFAEEVNLAFSPGAAPPVAPRDIRIVVSGALPPILDLEILRQELIPVRQMAADFDVLVTTVDGSAVFGFDVNNDFIGGFDAGVWAASPAIVEDLLD